METLTQLICVCSTNYWPFSLHPAL